MRLNDLNTAFSQQNSEPKIIEFINSGYSIHPGGHFQGIQRLDIAGKTYFVVSGSSEDEAYFVVVGEKSGKYEIIQKNVIGVNPYRHAGGIQVTDNYLFVGIEDNQKQNISQVLIFDISQPEQPIGKPITIIQREGQRKRATAGAVAMTRMDDGYLLVVGSWDSDTLDFYVSKDNTLNEFGFQFTWDRGKANRDGWSDNIWGNYQNLNLMKDTNDSIFLIGYYFDEENKMDYADLYSLHPEKAVPEILIKENSRQMNCRDGASFRYCGGCFIKDENTIISYACSADCSGYGVINEFN